jgi:hypothetical protein
LLALCGCEGTIGGIGPSEGFDVAPGHAGMPSGSGGSAIPPGSASGSGGTGPTDTPPLPTTFTPLTPCEPVLPRRVTRLSDRHLSHAIGDLLKIDRPAIETGSLAQAAFLPGKPAAVNGGVAVKLQEVAEAAAKQAMEFNAAAAACTGPEAECARAFIDRFGARAFRRPLTADERSALLGVYEDGREIEGNYRGGVSLVVEAVLQAPSFVYQPELGVAEDGGRYRLTAHELATKLSLYLTDTLPDDALWSAADSGALDAEAGLEAEVDRLLSTPEVKANLSSAFHRFFDLESLPDVKKSESLPNFSAGLLASLYSEGTFFVDDVLWNQSGSLGELLTSRAARLDPVAADLYGVPHSSGKGYVNVVLPEDERAGILTRAGLLAVKAHDDDTSVVHRGLMVARGLLCANPPPPDPAAVALGEQLRKTIPTERGRAEARLGMSCQGCHRIFDPVGITFENYGPLGEYRTVIPTEGGDVPVDAAFELTVADVHGKVENAVELSTRLAESRAARECVTQQIAAYAMGERIAPEDTCTVGELARRFEENRGDLRALLKDVATWPALRVRREATP